MPKTQKEATMKTQVDGLSIMSQGMEPGGRKGPSLELNPFEDGTPAEKAKAAAQAAAEAALAHKLALREQGGTTSTGGTRMSQAQWDLCALTYYKAKPGTAEVGWPAVTNNPVLNAPYASLAVSLHLQNSTTIPPLALSLADLKDMAKLQEFTEACSRFGLHPYIRYGFIAEDARRQISLC
jgi:hypothetical protein